MPVIKKDCIYRNQGIDFKYHIRYEPAKFGYSRKAEFLAIVDSSEHIIPDQLDERSVRGKKIFGKSGETEDKAKEELIAYFTKYAENGTVTSKVILIRDREGDTDFSHWYGLEGKKSSIHFEYLVAKKVIFQNQTSYMSSDEEAYSRRTCCVDPESWIEIPYSEENEKSCKMIIERFVQLQDAITKLFQTKGELAFKNMPLLLNNNNS